MTYGISDLSIIPVRSEPTEKSEMVSQILFGEHFEITETTEKWSKVKLAFDSYEGWVDSLMITQIEEDLFKKLNKDFPVVAMILLIWFFRKRIIQTNLLFQVVHSLFVIWIRRLSYWQISFIIIKVLFHLMVKNRKNLEIL